MPAAGGLATLFTAPLIGSLADRFGKKRVFTILALLSLAPIVDYRAPGVPGRVYLFDPAQPESDSLITTPPASAHAKCVGPSPLLHWR